MQVNAASGKRECVSNEAGDVQNRVSEGYEVSLNEEMRKGIRNSGWLHSVSSPSAMSGNAACMAGRSRMYTDILKIATREAAREKEKGYALWKRLLRYRALSGHQLKTAYS